MNGKSCFEQTKFGIYRTRRIPALRFIIDSPFPGSGFNQPHLLELSLHGAARNTE